MNKYIVSLVLAKKIPNATALLNSQGAQSYDISIQNEVNVVTAETPKQAYDTCLRLALQKHPGHNLIVHVVVEMNETMASDIN